MPRRLGGAGRRGNSRVANVSQFFENSMADSEMVLVHHPIPYFL